MNETDAVTWLESLCEDKTQASIRLEYDSREQPGREWSVCVENDHGRGASLPDACAELYDMLAKKIADRRAQVRSTTEAVDRYARHLATVRRPM